ncbi:MAG: hypothetical protein ACXWQZ_21155 [Ktedonobacterales bacterium]
MAQPISSLPDGQEPSTPVAVAEGARSAARALLGWFSEPEAIQALLGRMAGPLDNVIEARARWSERTAAVASRPNYRTANPITEMPDPQLAERIKARPDIQAIMGGLLWRPAMVNLQKVLSFQRFINLEGLDGRVARAAGSQEELLKLCLPEELPLSPAQVQADADQRGFTVTSLNPNLWVVGFNVGQAPISPAPGLPSLFALQIGVLVSTNQSYLQVVHYQNRYFIRDGYHRAAGLLRAGIVPAPCLVIEARGLNEVGLQPGLFPPDVILSERPPRLVDYWDDTVACDVMQPSVRKVVRVHASEFVIPR